MTTSSRLNGALPGGAPTRSDVINRQGTNTYGFGTPELGLATSVAPEKDWRVRISLPPNSKFAYRMAADGDIIDSIESPLVGGGKPGTDGVVFPHTPQMTITHNARYQEQALTHSNYKAYFYEGSDISSIQVSGLFTCQNAKEAHYLQAALQFLRACTKMHFGKSTKPTSMPAGTPPTLVRLSGYGDFYLPSISCVVTSVSHAMPDDCDYIRFDYGNFRGWMPTSSTLTVTLQPVLSRQRQASEISLDDFAAGKLIASADVRGGIL